MIISVSPSWSPSGSAVADAIARGIAEGKSPERVYALIERATNSAISGESYLIMKGIKTAIKENTFGWPAKRAYTPTGDVMQSVIARLGPMKTKKAGRNRPPAPTPGPFYGKLGRLFFYQLNKTAKSARIGIIPGYKRTGRNAETMALWLANGGEDPVTNRMRGFMGAIGLPLKGTTTIIKTPPRPLVGKFLDTQQGHITDRLEKRFIERLLGYK